MCARTNPFHSPMRCKKKASFFFFWEHSLQLAKIVIAIIVFIAAMFTLDGYSLGDLVGPREAHSTANITCSLEYRDETENTNKRTLNIVITNHGRIEIVSMSVDVKVYQYDSEKNVITAVAIQGQKSFDEAFHAQKHKTFDELRCSTLELSGKNVLAVYVVSVTYQTEPNMPPVILESHFFVENQTIKDRTKFEKNERYNLVMQRLQAFDHPQEPSSPATGADHPRTKVGEPTAAPVITPPTAVGKKDTPSRPPIIKPLSVQVNYVYRAGGTGPLLPIKSGEDLSSGDHYKIFFNATRDCFVYIFQIDAAGQIFRLFPMERFDGVVLNHQNPVIGGTTIVLPSKDRFFYLDNTIGRETIYFVASFQRNMDLEKIENKINSARQSNDTARVSQIRKDLAAYLTGQVNSQSTTTQATPVAWQSGDATSPVTGHLLEILDQSSIHKVEFMHR